ncbi:MAG: hypothetical protein EOP84_00670 [Verrucomicrobiaceae bacterium]|nr:MAG: hypothetical protein EOP84_00670 [Verrucomicrobiaceae bacterium]
MSWQVPIVQPTKRDSTAAAHEMKITLFIFRKHDDFGIRKVSFDQSFAGDSEGNGRPLPVEQQQIDVLCAVLTSEKGTEPQDCGRCDQINLASA